MSEDLTKQFLYTRPSFKNRDEEGKYIKLLINSFSFV
jgi:hypothetical protein